MMSKNPFPPKIKLKPEIEDTISKHKLCSEIINQYMICWELGARIYEKIDIIVHGGLTYTRSSLATVDRTGWFIGWDYSHYGDFTGADMMFPPELQFGGKQWTTEEIIDECLNVINQMVKNQMV